jgi:hypothetical protein
LPLQIPEAQTALDEYLRHARAPSHNPSLAQVVEPSSGQSWSGSSPALIGWHMPSG